MSKIPVTILTGFLGSGKTTLLNRILQEKHGKKIAVIENEFGEIGIDQQLILRAKEEIVEMNNGCICCTVRGDLIRIISKLIERREKIDHILIETTGLADPAPVAQTFFTDELMKESVYLDSIVTLIDAYHVNQHKQDPEALKQVAFADRIVLNKIDLVKSHELRKLEDWIQSVNPTAKVHTAIQSDVPIDFVFDVGGFALDRALEIDSLFLADERPFEYVGVYNGPLEGEASFTDVPSIGVLWSRAPDTLNESALTKLAEAFRTEDGLVDGTLPEGRRQLWNGGLLHIPFHGRVVVCTEHRPDEIDLVWKQDDKEIEPIESKHFKGEHHHDTEVSSLGLESTTPLHGQKLNEWMGRILREQGQDIFRMKGVLHIADDSRRYIFQGVHMLLDAKPGDVWAPEEKKRSQLIFIGRHLDRHALEAGFRACQA